MSFSPVGPFTFGGKLTSAQANQLDANVVNSLDKSTAGDTISGHVHFAATTGRIVADQSGCLVATVSGAVTMNTAGGVLSNIAGGITSTTAAGISTGTVGGIAATIAGGIGGGVANGISSGVDGGIALSGSAGDYIQYLTPRTAVFFVRPVVSSLQTGWMPAPFTPAVSGPGTNASQYFMLDKMLNGLITGATLSSVTMVMAVGTTHSGVPATMPSFKIQRIAVNGIGSPIPAAQDLYSGSAVTFATPGSGAAWYDSANLKSLTMTCNQNNAIVTNGYVYYAVVTDENGANALSGNAYFGFLLTFTGISNSAPLA